MLVVNLIFLNLVLSNITCIVLGSCKNLKTLKMSYHDQGVFYDYVDNLCSNCQKETSELKLCGGCGVTQYCSIDCQSHHWQSEDLKEFSHKNWCRKIKDANSQALQGNYQPLDEFNYVLGPDKKEIEIFGDEKMHFSDSDSDNETDGKLYQFEEEGALGTVDDSEDSVESEETVDDEEEEDLEGDEEGEFEEEGGETGGMVDEGEDLDGDEENEGGVFEGDDEFLDQPPDEFEISEMIESDLADLEGLQGNNMEKIGRWFWHSPSQSWSWRTGLYSPVFWLLFGWRPWWWRPRRFFGRRRRRLRPTFRPRFSRAARRRLARRRGRRGRRGLGLLPGPLLPPGPIIVGPGRRVPVPGRRVGPPRRVPGPRIPGPRVPPRRVPGRRVPVQRRPLRPLRPFVPPILRI